MDVIGSACVIGLNNLDSVENWSKTKRGWIVGVIHEVTEGLSFRDPAYTAWRQAATGYGLLWGSYHFASGGRPFLSDMMEGRRRSVVSICPRWDAEYPAQIHDRPQHPLPESWTDWTIGHYATDGVGPEPRQVDGIAACDRDTFNGSIAHLKAQWPFDRLLSTTQ